MLFLGIVLVFWGLNFIFFFVESKMLCKMVRFLGRM